jgi:hypothetical protein
VSGAAAEGGEQRDAGAPAARTGRVRARRVRDAVHDRERRPAAESDLEPPLESARVPRGAAAAGQPGRRQGQKVQQAARELHVERAHPARPDGPARVLQKGVHTRHGAGGHSVFLKFQIK